MSEKPLHPSRMRQDTLQRKGSKVSVSSHSKGLSSTQDESGVEAQGRWSGPSHTTRNKAEEGRKRQAMLAPNRSRHFQLIVSPSPELCVVPMFTLKPASPK